MAQGAPPGAVNTAPEWGRSVPDVWQAQMLRAAGQTALLLPRAKDPMLQSSDCTSALHWVNSIADDTRHAIIKHSQQVERQLAVQSAGQHLPAAVLTAYTPYMPSSGPNTPVKATDLLRPHPPGQYHLLAPHVVDVIQAPTCWSCQPKLDDEQWKQLLDAARRKQLAAAGHPVPQPQQHCTPAPYLAVQAAAQRRVPAIAAQDHNLKDQQQQQLTEAALVSHNQDPSNDDATQTVHTHTAGGALEPVCSTEASAAPQQDGQQVIREDDHAAQLAAAGVMQDAQLQQHSLAAAHAQLPGFVQVADDVQNAGFVPGALAQHQMQLSEWQQQQQWQQPELQHQLLLHHQVPLEGAQLMMHGAAEQPFLQPQASAQTKRPWRPWLCCGRGTAPDVVPQQTQGLPPAPVPHDVWPGAAAAGGTYTSNMVQPPQLIDLQQTHPPPQQLLQQQDSAPVQKVWQTQPPTPLMTGSVPDATAVQEWNHLASATAGSMRQQQHTGVQASAAAGLNAGTPMQLHQAAVQGTGSALVTQPGLLPVSEAPGTGQLAADSMTHPTTHSNARQAATALTGSISSTPPAPSLPEQGPTAPTFAATAHQVAAIGGAAVTPDLQHPAAVVAP